MFYPSDKLKFTKVLTVRVNKNKLNSFVIELNLNTA